MARFVLDEKVNASSIKPGTKKTDIKETNVYGTAQMNEKLTFDAFSKHIADHDSPFSKGTIKGVLSYTAKVIATRTRLKASSK